MHVQCTLYSGKYFSNICGLFFLTLTFHSSFKIAGGKGEVELAPPLESVSSQPTEDMSEKAPDSNINSSIKIVLLLLRRAYP